MPLTCSSFFNKTFPSSRGDASMLERLNRRKLVGDLLVQATAKGGNDLASALANVRPSADGS